MKTKRIQALGVAALIGLCAVALLLGGLQQEQRQTSVLSASPSGRRAAFLLLQELGLSAERWTKPPAFLPSGPLVLWILQAPLPSAPAEQAEPRESDALDAALASSMHGPSQYRSFVEDGGTLIVAAREQVFLEEVLSMEPGEIRHAPGDVRPEAVRAVGGDGDEFALDWSAPAELDPESLFPEGPALLEGPRSECFAARWILGKGSVVALASDHFLSNQAIAKADHARVFLWLCELAGPGSAVLFDETEPFSPRSPLSVAFLGRPGLFAWSLLALLLLAVWRAAWPGAFARDPEEIEQVSALARARGLAQLLERAERFDLLARSLLQAAERELERVSAVERARWIDIFAGRQVRTRRDLEALQQDLARLRSLAATSARRASDPRAPPQGS